MSQSKTQVSRAKTRSFYNKSLVYSFVGLIIIIGFALLVSGVSIFINGYFGPINPLLMGLIIFVLALLFLPIKGKLSQIVDTTFFRGDNVIRSQIQAFQTELSKTVTIKDILLILREFIQKGFHPFPLHIYYFDPLTEQYIASELPDGTSTSEIRFSSNSPLIKLFEEKNGPIALTGSGKQQKMMQTDRTRINLLGSGLLIPILGDDQVLGWIGVGPKSDDEPYLSEDIRYLALLAENTAKEIEKVQVLAEMEDRVRELNMLTRVAQGINITINQDDILELIYAQTTQLIAADDFSIIVFDRTHQKYSQLFYVENNERLTEKETLFIDLENRLEKEVISFQRPFITNNYERECERRKVINYKKNIFSWMAVPILSGAETIGVLSLGRRDLDVIYTQQHVKILETIADQLAGAIEKSRLLTETQKRALQLAGLNEVSRKLTSNLDTQSLLESILHNAVEILDCEAGTLFMVDDETLELVFRVTVGPVDRDLVNKRIPMDKGLVGKALTQRKPIRVNDVKESNDWMSQIDQTTGFQTKSVLVIPLESKEKIIGVIEIINKKDGSPFTHDDEQLLMAFAGQAAVSIENARLYTLTDQQLEARLEELSILQRIGRELNASLDSGRAMQITLEWAIHQSRADAGFIGLIDSGMLRVMATIGYHGELNTDEEGLFDLSDDRFAEILNKGISKSIFVRDHPGANFLQNGSQLLAIPIRRENIPIGILVLEKTTEEVVPEDFFNFMERLTDHAAIAISNAQLYSAVQKANLAKSEFVSFVSHELKNPMTSIKGYTELLAAGAVGETNDAQQNFLNTIRANVDRMATLVSDLADESRIEAGRLRLEFEILDIKKIIEEVIRSEKRLIDEKNLNLIVEIDENLPSVWADHTRIVQIITNLVSNSRKYTQDGGQIWISARMYESERAETPQPKMLQMSVKDNGLGISKEDQEMIFQKFFRAEDVKTREMPGTGLGLNITRSLIEAQGGSIWFESEFRKGTVFHFTIPISEN